jgi:hypothetical protein
MPKPQHLRWPARESGDGPRDQRIRRFEDPLDVWLKQELNKLYGGVADEPLPPALLKLLRAYETRLHTEREEETLEP